MDEASKTTDTPAQAAARGWLHGYGINTSRYVDGGGDHPAMQTLPQAFEAFARSVKELPIPNETTAWGDKSDQWSDRIVAAHPMRTGGHNIYAVAMEMVGNRRSKRALVELVNWLLKGQP